MTKYRNSKSQSYFNLFIKKYASKAFVDVEISMVYAHEFDKFLHARYNCSYVLPEGGISYAWEN